MVWPTTILNELGFTLDADSAQKKLFGPQKGKNEEPEICAHIRWMIRRDMPEVLQIERESFEFPWSEEDFLRCLRQRNCIGMVAERDDRVVGFMIYELYETRLHILNFAVHSDFCRKGVGRRMAAKLISKLNWERRTAISLEVRETNLAAQLFFRKMGFRAISVVRNFYDDTTEDAYLMQYALTEKEKQTAFQNTDIIGRIYG